MKKYHQYQQGIFYPNNIKKYKGTKPILYRSALEKKFMIWCDNNSNVIEWGSESIVIPYIKPLDQRIHRYYIDFNLILNTNNNIAQKYLVEIKPHKYTLPPKESKRKKSSTILFEKTNYVINQAKWDAARQYAKKINAKFIIITEKHLK